jgi:hypothetical protein
MDSSTVKADDTANVWELVESLVEEAEVALRMQRQEALDAGQPEQRHSARPLAAFRPRRCRAWRPVGHRASSCRRSGRLSH